MEGESIITVHKLRTVCRSMGVMHGKSECWTTAHHRWENEKIASVEYANEWQIIWRMHCARCTTDHDNGNISKIALIHVFKWAWMLSCRHGIWGCWNVVGILLDSLCVCVWVCERESGLVFMVTDLRHSMTIHNFVVVVVVSQQSSLSYRSESETEFH